MKTQQEKRDYIRLKYTDLANKILEIIDSDTKLDYEIKHNLVRLWQIQHFLDCKIVSWEKYLNMNNNIEDGNRDEA